jgi:hypothetical protein
VQLLTNLASIFDTFELICAEFPGWNSVKEEFIKTGISVVNVGVLRFKSKAKSFWEPKVLIKSREETSCAKHVAHFARPVEFQGIQEEWEEVSDECGEKPADSHGERHCIRAETIGWNF